MEDRCFIYSKTNLLAFYNIWFWKLYKWRKHLMLKQLKNSNFSLNFKKLSGQTESIGFEVLQDKGWNKKEYMKYWSKKRNKTIFSGTVLSINNGSAVDWRLSHCEFQWPALKLHYYCFELYKKYSVLSNPNETVVNKR